MGIKPTKEPTAFFDAVAVAASGEAEIVTRREREPAHARDDERLGDNDVVSGIEGKHMRARPAQRGVERDVLARHRDVALAEHGREIGNVEICVLRRRRALHPL